MTTIQWILLDHVAALVSVATWFGAGVATALNRVRLGLGFLVAAVVATLIRVSTVVMLARAGGWWFAQEKVLLGLPMLAVTGLAAALIAGRPLLEARRAPDQVLPASSVVALLTAAYAALAGLVVTFVVGYPLTWGAALITIAFVCLGALLTARASHFRADQVGTYWYHTHQASHEGVRKGLYGTLVVHPRAPKPEEGKAAAELDLTLPVHTFEGTVLIGDRDARADHTAAAGTPVRLRLINTDSDPHWFTLAGTAFRVAGVDGRDLNQPGEVSEVGLRLPAGGR